MVRNSFRVKELRKSQRLTYCDHGSWEFSSELLLAPEMAAIYKGTARVTIVGFKHI